MHTNLDEQGRSKVVARIAGLFRSSTQLARPLAVMPQVLLAVFLAVVSAPTPLSAAPQAPGPSTQTIWELAKISVQIDEFNSELLVRAAQYQGGLSEPQHKELYETVASVAVPKRAQKIAFEAFEGVFDPEAARRVETWYKSALGEQILAAEIAAGQDDFGAHIKAFASDVLPRMNVSPKRSETLRRFATATRAAEDAVGMQANIRHILALAARATRPAKERRKLEIIEAQAVAQAAVALDIVREDLPTILLYLYAEIGDEDLIAYAEFCESTGAAWLFSALRHATDSLATRFQREIVGKLEAEGGRAAAPDPPIPPATASFAQDPAQAGVLVSPRDRRDRAQRQAWRAHDGWPGGS